MARFGLVGPSYRSQSVLADCQTCMNWYPESIESQAGKGAFALYPTPGLALLYNLGSAAVRGISTAQGRTFAIAGTVLWELLPPTSQSGDAGTNRINRGNVVSDGQPVSMIGGPTQVLIASAGNLYCFQLVANVGTGAAANSLTLVAPYNNASGLGLLGPVAMVTYSDGFFFALIANSNQIQSSNALDGSTWQGTNETQVSVFSDNVVAIFTAFRLMFVFGPKAIQPYQDTGDFPFPFDVIGGTYVENGIAAPFSVAKMDNSVFWLGSDERGNGMVWRANGFTPQRISNHAIEFALQSYSRIDDAIAYSYQDQGHSFYVLSFPTADKTWVYDAATGMWHERGFLNPKTGLYNRHRAAFHTFNFGMHLVGDPVTGSVYQMAINIYSDFGNPIRRARRAPHISKEQERIPHWRLQLDIEVGLGPTFQGNLPADKFYLQDVNGGNWATGVTDTGVLQATGNAPDEAQALFLNDPTTNTSWQITVTPLGALAPIPVSYDPAYPPTFLMASITGNSVWIVGVKEVDALLGLAQLTTSPLGMVGRGPQVMLRWSNDGGQTWSNEYARDCGQLGDYKRRVMWNRLGLARDRVYEISTSDPWPARIVDAYLKAGGYEASERLTKEMAKRA